MNTNENAGLSNDEAPVCNRCDDSILPGQPVEMLDDEYVHRRCYENYVEGRAEYDHASRMNGEGGSSSAHYQAALRDAGRAHWL